MSPVQDRNQPANVVPSTEQINEAQPTWGNHIRTNFVSAFDAVKQAAGQRNLMIHPWGAGGSAHHQEDKPQDRYTPLALRPGRKSIGGFPARITSKEGRELGFGRAESDERKERRSSAESQRRDEEEEDLESLRMGHRFGLEHLGKFSFEGRSIKSWGLRSKAEVPVGSVQKGSVAHSTSLKSRPSEICSKPFSSSASGSSSSSGHVHTDGMMRKRKSKEPRVSPISRGDG
jgi:hypothetical protein